MVYRLVRGEEISETDNLSRLSNTDDYQLTDWAFRRIVHHFGMPDVDLFASRFTAKTADFCCHRPDETAMAQDAFTIDWSHRELGTTYAFPQPKLLFKTIRKVVADRASTIIVTPNHYGNPWIPLIEQLRVWNLHVSKPIHLPSGSVTDILPGRETEWNWLALHLDATDAPLWN